MGDLEVEPQHPSTARMRRFVAAESGRPSLALSRCAGIVRWASRLGATSAACQWVDIGIMGRRAGQQAGHSLAQPAAAGVQRLSPAACTLYDTRPAARPPPTWCPRAAHLRGGVAAQVRRWRLASAVGGEPATQPGHAAPTRLSIRQVEVVDARPAMGRAPADRQQHAAGGGAALRAAHVPPCAGEQQQGSNVRVDCMAAGVKARTPKACLTPILGLLVDKKPAW